MDSARIPSNSTNGEDDRTIQAALPSEPSTPTEHYRLLALAVLTAGLIGLCVLLSIPFLPALTWAVALAIIAWPMHAWISRYLSWPGVAAVVSAVLVMVIILVPMFFVTYQIAREAGSATEQVQEKATDGAIRTRMAQTPFLSEVVAWMDRVNVDVEREVRRVVAAYTQDAAALLQGSLAAAVQFAVAAFVLFYLFRDRTRLLQGVRDVLPLTRAESDQVFRRAADSVYANLYATIVTSTMDGVGFGLMFWLLGLPSPVLWGVVVFVLSILPVLGSGIVWVPAAAYLAVSDRWPAAAALVSFGIVWWFIVDNVVYVRIAGDRMRMHDVPALVAFLGGLALFGAAGMILGPAILAVTVAILEVWRQRSVRENDAATTESPGNRKSARPVVQPVS